MSKQPERPKRVAGPPVRLVTVKNTGRVGRDAVAAAQLREFFRLDVIADHVVLEIGPPIDVHRTRNMPSVVKQDVFVRLDDPDAIVFEMFLQPIGFHQRLWMRVLHRVRCHRNRNSIRCHASASEFANAALGLPYFGDDEAV
jgi:hypothetical protein